MRDSAWRENNQPLATLPLVFPPNDVWETSAEIPYWWRVTTQIWVVLLIGCFFFSTNQKHYLDLGGDGSSVWTALVSTQKTVLWPREMITSSCWIKRKCIQINRERTKNTIQENDSEDRVGRWIWKKNLENSRPPGFYLMRKREKLAWIMVGTKVVCDRLRSCNLSSWLMKAFSTNDFAIVCPS